MAGKFVEKVGPATQQVTDLPRADYFLANLWIQYLRLGQPMFKFARARLEICGQLPWEATPPFAARRRPEFDR